MNSLLTSLPTLLPVAYAWAEKQELIILEKGSPLREDQLADARRAGVARPEAVRLIHAEELPQPENDDVMFIARHIGLYSGQSAGLTLGQGICLKQGYWDDRLALVHECVHVSQYERLGGIRPFLDLYLRECIDPGYPFGRLEREAILVAREICKSARTVAGGPVV